jgi:uncharacterized SAM-binding protein YcdF (DUF218 family)
MVAGADVIRYLLSAGGVILLVLIASLWVFFSSRSRRAARGLLALAVTLTLLGNVGVQLLVFRALVGSLMPFKAGDAPAARRTAIVILGSGSFDAEDWDGRRISTPDRAGAARVLEAVRVFALLHPAIVISSGGNPHPERRSTPGGETMRELLVTLGIPNDRIVLEAQSLTTRDEAVIVAPMLRAQGTDRVILVTSPNHMRRALGSFRAAGIDPIPAIAQEFPPAELSRSDFILPSELGLYLASSNAHEILGLVYYRLRGWLK